MECIHSYWPWGQGRGRVWRCCGWSPGGSASPTDPLFCHTQPGSYHTHNSHGHVIHIIVRIMSQTSSPDIIHTDICYTYTHTHTLSWPCHTHNHDHVTHTVMFTSHTDPQDHVTHSVMIMSHTDIHGHATHTAIVALHMLTLMVISHTPTVMVMVHTLTDTVTSHPLTDLNLQRAMPSLTRCWTPPWWTPSSWSPCLSGWPPSGWGAGQSPPPQRDALPSRAYLPASQRTWWRSSSLLSALQTSAAGCANRQKVNTMVWIS